MLGIDSGTLATSVEGSGYLEVQGITNRFDASAAGTSRLNAKCLYARTIFINTADSAQAEVADNGTISAFAADQSDIYYYQTPKMVAAHERLSGSVLRMKGLADPRAPFLLPPPPEVTPQNAIMTPVALASK